MRNKSNQKHNKLDKKSLTLEEYFKSDFTGSQADFARLINRTDGYITKIKSFKVTPSLNEAIVISLATGGRVSIVNLTTPAKLKNHLLNNNLDPNDFDLSKLNLVQD